VQEDQVVGGLSQFVCTVSRLQELLLFSAGVRDYGLLHSVKTRSRACSTFRSVGTGDFFPGREANHLLPRSEE
jgi:hypothetical protein